jgi:dTDP-4-amino-4,6-dideoxygalactose transaminase
MLPPQSKEGDRMIPLFKVAMHPSAKEFVAHTLDSGYIGQGARVEEFEARFAQLVDAPYPPLTINSCTSALDLALHLIGIGPGDEVISTPMTCTATNTVVVTRHARIVWADVHPITGLIDPDDVARKITARTKAILAVDWSGRACDYAALRSFGVPVIEDAAHALLTKFQGQSIAQTGGDYVCWSFQAIKHLTTGDGGALLPPSEQLERGRLLRWYGLDRRSSQSFRCDQNIREAGYKYHMNDIAASIGLANLPTVEAMVCAHRKNATWYHTRLVGLPCVTLPPPDEESSWWLYTLLVEDRNAFIAFLKEKGIESSPVHSRNDKHEAFTFPSGPLPGVDFFAEHEVAIPVGWWVTEEKRDAISQAIIAWAEYYAR